MTQLSEADLAAQVIERLLTDPAFRTRFRRDPAGACRDAGLDRLAQEMSVGAAGGKAFHTLDMRESRSSLAGVMMAAAMEGVGIYQFSENVLPHIEEMPRKVADVVSRIDLPAIKLPGLGGGDAVKASDGGGAAAVAQPDLTGGGAPAGAAASAAAPPAAVVPASAAPSGTLPTDGAAAPGADAPAEAPKPDAVPAEPDPAKEAAEKIAAANSPGAEKDAAVAGASDALAEQGAAPDSSGLPTGEPAAGAAPAGSLPDTPPEQATAPPDPAGAPPGLPETAPATDAPPPGLPEAPASSSALPEAPVSNSSLPESAPMVPISASGPGPDTLALTTNPNVVLDPTGIADLQAGRVDPRIVDVLSKLSAEHKITVTSVANGLDIGAIDGEAVSPDSPLARALASDLASLDPHPDVISTPFQISSPGYVTDTAHQDRLHIAFNAAPAAPVASAAAAPVAAAPAVAAAPVAAPAVAAAPPVEPPPAPVRDSQMFQAIDAKAAAAGAGQKATDSQMFLKAVEPPKASASAAPAQPVASAAAVQPGVPALVDLSSAPDAYPGDNAPREQIAAWMAGQAEKRGLPPELPLMASLVESGMKNLNFGDADSVGFFQMRVGIWNQGAYAGYPEKPELQVKWFLDTAEQVKKARVAAGKPIDDPNSYGDWIADVERPAAQYRGRYQTKLEEAQGLLKSRPAAGAAVPQPVVSAAPAPVVEAAAAVNGGGGGGTSPLGSAALTIAKTQLGVAETGGANRGEKVEEYLAAAKVAPGNPWCASFVTWALGKAGHEMPGGGWAAVQTWVRAAEQGQNGLQIVSADQARPGDIVVYDWGGQEDFAGDGHIGFLDSTVQNGKFTALEGNNADKVNSVPRQMGGANIKFLRIEGQGTAAAAAPAAPVAPAVQYVQPNTPYAQPPVPAAQALAPADTPYAQPGGGGQPVAAAVENAPAAARKPIDPSQFGGDGTGGAPDPEALALLDNKNIVLDADGIKDIKAGRIDPRVVAVMTKLSQEHKITVTCMCSDHDKFTAGGSVSNHHFGRGMDIGAIDGEIVGPGSPLARAVASELSSLNSDIRPNEIGSPFAISGPGYFTDAAHQNHLHIGFKEAITPDWKPPADVTANGAAPVAAAPVAAVPAAAPAPVASAAAVAPAPAVAAAAAAPPEPAGTHDSQMFQAVGKASAAAAGGGGKRGDSQMFLKAVEPPPASASAAAPVQPVASAAAVQPGAPGVVDVAAVAAAAPDAYPGDSAPREQIAAWMAGQAEKRGLPPQLPLMASLVESGMKNLNFGDADSVGFFQMRVGIWNQGAYAGYPEKPELQVKWFLDQAEAVKRQRLAAGKSVTDQNQFGEWIADVERPAAQYRGRYQTKLEEANGLLASAPSAQPAAAAPVVAAAQPVAAPVVDPAAAAAVSGGGLPPEIAAPLQEAMAAGNAPGPKAMAAIQEATKYLGTDYKWGGSTPQTGFDCSGLMQWAYAQSGVQIPRVTYTQIEAPNGVEIADRAALKPGDLVFFAANGDVHHVGMFLGGDKFIHAPHTGDVVKVSSLSEPYYAGQFAGGRRFDAAAGVAAVPAGQPVAAGAPVASAAAAAPAIDPAAVAQAQAAVARDAAEVRRNDSQLFQAIKAVESKKDEQVKSNSMMFLKAVDPAEVRREAAVAPVASAAAAPPAVPPVAPAPVAPAPAAAVPAVNVSAPAPAGGGVAAVSVDLSAASAEYPGNDASQAELAKWLSKQAEKAGLPPELPVMASLVESGVKNLNFGDRHSVGFFQMRTAIWNQGAYKGYPEKPELQAKWFIDQALALKRKRIAEGDANFGTDPSKFGEWIADVERPAEEYRGRYQLRLDEARKLLST